LTSLPMQDARHRTDGSCCEPGLHQGLELVSISSIFPTKKSTWTTNMGRKLVRRMPTEKDRSNKLSKGHITIIVAQHVLLYSSGYVIASTAYLIHTRIVTNDLLPAAVILVFAVSFYVVGRHIS
jgi:hypothetical protein